MDLSGTWRAVEANDELRRDAIGSDVDDSAWPQIEVPGHWRSHSEFSASDGPLLYRCRYRADPPADGRRRFVTFDGVFYQADAWLDGAYLGDLVGYFFPHSFDVTELSRLGHRGGAPDEHVLAVEVTCSPEPGPTGRRNVTGVLQQSEAVDHDWNPGGLWRGVRLTDTGSVRIDRLRVLCRDADETRAHLRLHARLDSLDARTVRVRSLADGAVVDESEHAIAAGGNEIDWTLDLAEPSLWWPRGLGDQPLTTIGVEVVTDGEVSDHQERRTGLREVAWNNWVCSINGERLFLKGANVLPTRPGLADASTELVRGDVELAVAAGLDAIRLQAHVAGDALYDAADELGVLILQDLPLQWSYGRAVRKDAMYQARAMVDTLGHHPSIVQWCAHAAPMPDASPGREAAESSSTTTTTGTTTAAAATAAADMRRGRLGHFLWHQVPTWNKTVLDRWVKRALDDSDPTRPTVAHGGVAPHLPRLDGTDSYLWLGWERGEIHDLADTARTIPRMVRFVGRFGAQSVPTSAGEFVDADRWPDLDWEALARHHGLDIDSMLRRHPPDRYGSFAAWRTATQRYQAELLRHHIETLRRLKYRPTGGFTFSWFADPAPMISASILDHDRQHKLAWQAVVDACRPVIVITDPLPPALAPGEDVDLAIHVVNDLRRPIEATLSATVSWRGGSKQWAFRGDAAADSCELVGRIRFAAPDAQGDLLLGLALNGRDEAGDDVRATRRAGSRVNDG